MIQKSFSINSSPRVIKIQETRICLGEIFEYRGKYYNTSGIYTDTVHTQLGYDSLFTLRLSVSDCSNNSEGGYTSSFLIYPNPTEADVNIKVSDKEVIQWIKLYDLNGREIKVSYTLSNNQAIIKTDHLSSYGVYAVEVKTDRKIYTGRFQLER